MKSYRRAFTVFSLIMIIALAACGPKSEPETGGASANSSSSANSSDSEQNSTAAAGRADAEETKIDQEDAGRTAMRFAMYYGDLLDISAQQNANLSFEKLSDLEREELFGCAPDNTGTYTVITCSDGEHTDNMLMLFYMDGETERIRIVGQFRSTEDCEKAFRAILPLFSEGIQDSDIDSLAGAHFFVADRKTDSIAGVDFGVKKMINIVGWADAPRESMTFM